MTSRLALIVFCLFASCGLAEAHRPYFTERVAIDLPEGQRGELRLLHGDGIFFADPVYAVIVNAESRIVARSHQSHHFVIGCPTKLVCRALDVGRSVIFEPDPATFRLDGPLVQNADGSESDRWQWLDERESRTSWGFFKRPMSLMEKVKAEYAFATRNWFELLISMALGSLAALPVLFSLHIMRPPKSVFRFAAWLVVLGLCFVGSAVFVLGSLWWVALVGLTSIAWMASTGAGMFIVVTGWFIMRRRLTPPSPSPAA